MKYSTLIICSITVLLLVTACCVPLFISPVCSQTSTTVFILPSTVSAFLDESFTITLGLSNVQNLYSLEVILHWDPTVLRAANVEIRLGMETFSDGVLHESSSSPSIFIAENNLTQGEYRLVATSMAPASPFSGSGNIARITFDPLKIGSSAFDLDSQLFDYPPFDRDPRVSYPISHSTQDSFVTIEERAPNPEPPPTDKTSPKIIVLSPANRTYNESSISLVFTVSEPFNWTGYSLDNRENVTVNGNATITDLANDLHNVTVFANDSAGNMGVSEILSFTVDVPEPKPESFPLVPIAAISALIVTAAGFGALIYFKKQEHRS